KRQLASNSKLINNYYRPLARDGLMEVTTVGTKFTWRGPQWNGRDRVFKKLDRVLCNVSWRLRYHEGFAKVLPRVQSDHHPIIVLLEGEPNVGKNRPFRFEAAWTTHDNFQQVLQENWTRERDLVFLLSNLTNNLKELQDQLATTLYQEECLWYQKSRGKWITDGDHNTKYYHSKTIVRRRRNKIVSLRNEAGDWIENQEDLSNMVRNFYINLYKEEILIRDAIVSWKTYPQHLETEHRKLSAPVHFSECKQALFDMGPHKAPGVV
ncbi:hypothetical protein TSUD_402360, partial [Trifolium subterraneum]